MKYTRKDRAKEIARKRMEAIWWNVKLRRQTIVNLIVPCDWSCYDENCPWWMQDNNKVTEYTNNMIKNTF